MARANTSEPQELPQYTVPEKTKYMKEDDVQEMIDQAFNNMVGVVRVKAGEILTDNGGGFQISYGGGKTSFRKDGVEQAFIMTASDGQSLQMACGTYWYITKLDGTPIMRFDQNSNLDFSADGSGKGQITWPSGNYIKPMGATILIGGDIIGSAGIAATTNFTADNKGGQTGSFKDQGGSTITVTGGIITNGL